MVKLTKVYPGSRDAIAAIRQQGLATAIASSKYRKRISAVLAQHELTDLFEHVIGGEDVVNTHANRQVLVICSPSP